MKRPTLLALVLIVLVSLFLFRAAYEKVKTGQIEALNQEQRSHARLAKAGIEGFIQYHLKMLEHLARHPEIISFSEDGRKLMRETYALSKADIRSITRVNAQGRFVYTIPGQEKYAGTNVSHRNFFQKMKRTRQPVVSNIITSAKGEERAIALHVPVLKQGIFDGSMAIIVSIDDLAARYLWDIKIQETGYCWMLSREGMELYCPVPGHIGKTIYETSSQFPTVIAMAEKMMRGEEGVATYDYDRIRGMETETIKKHAVYMPIRVGDALWSIVVATPEDEILANMAGFRNRLFAIIALLLIGVFLFSYYLLKAWTIIQEEERRKQVEEALRQSEEKYRVVSENIPVAVYSALPDERSSNLFLSGRMRELTGYTIAAFLRDPDLWTRIIHPEDRAHVWEEIKKHREKKTILDVEYRIITKTGEIKWVRDKATPVLDDNRNIVRIDGFMDDVTERKQAEEALRESEEKYRIHFENVSDVVYSYDRSLKILNVSPSVERILGYAPGEIIGKSFHEINILPAEYLENAVSDAMRVFAGERISTSVYEFIARDGTRKYGEVSGAPMIRNGEITAIISIARDITERRHFEEALRESWQRLADIIDFLPDATVVIDREGTVVSWNKAMEEMTGVTADEIVGKGDYEYALPFYGERRPILIDLIFFPAEEDFEKKYQFVRREGDTIIAEVEIPDLKGRRAWVMGIASPLRDSRGNLVGAIESVRDITDRRDAEDLYMTLANNSQVGVYIIQKGRIVFSNPHIPRYSGYAMEELIGSRIISYVLPEDREMVKENAEKMLKGGLSSPYEYRILDKEGRIRWLMETVTPIQYQRKPAILGNTMDITEFKRAEETIFRSEQKYRALVENANSIVLWWDTRGNILFMNPYGLDFFGYREDELVGRNVLGTIVPETESMTQRDLASLMVDIRKDPDKFKNTEYENVTKAGHRVWVSWTNKAIRDDRRNIMEILSIGNDVTDKKKLEAELLQAQKMEAIGTFAGGIAHDFNNILGAIIGFAEIVDRRLPKDSPERRYIANILKGCERATDLVKQILFFSRKQEQQMRPTYLAPLVKETLKLMRASLPATIEIVQKIETDLDVVFADPTQIHQVLMNLYSNSAYAMREKGGVLEVEVQNHEVHADPGLPPTELPPGSYVKLTVKDTGLGIDPANINRIFDPFFTTKELGEGTGLGLAVVHGIVAAHGGSVDVESDVGKGTSFYVYLPVYQEVLSVPPADVESMLPGGNERILFVDDETALIEVAQAALEHLGYEVVAKLGSLEALDAFRLYPERFDLVITDLTMPKMTGIKLAEEILRIRADIPIILCTGFNDLVTREQAMKLGFRDLMMKPVVMKDIARSIRGVLDGK